MSSDRRLDPQHDDRIFDRDRPEHTARRKKFVIHVGRAAYTPHLRVSGNGNEWCKFVMYEHGTRFDQGRPTNWTRTWGVYAFGDLARHASECIRKGDRIIVYGFERGRNEWIDKQGKPRMLDDITAWDLGQSMKVNHAFSERNGSSRYARNQVRQETGRPELERYTDEQGSPPEHY